MELIIIMLPTSIERIKDIVRITVFIGIKVLVGITVTDIIGIEGHREIYIPNNAVYRRTRRLKKGGFACTCSII